MKQWQRFYSRGGAFYCDGKIQSDQETLAALNASERAKEEIERLKAELEACEASLDDEEVGHVETMSLLARAKAEVERLKAELAAYKPKADWREDADSGENTKWKLFVSNEWRASMYQLILGNKIVWATTYTPGTYETAEEAKAAVEEAMQQSRNP